MTAWTTSPDPVAVFMAAVEADNPAKAGWVDERLVAIGLAAVLNPEVAAEFMRAVDEVATELADALERADRLTKALQVCEHVAHRAEPTDAEVHAAQQASHAYWTDWQSRHVHDDLPDFVYGREVGNG